MCVVPPEPAPKKLLPRVRSGRDPCPPAALPPPPLPPRLRRASSEGDLNGCCCSGGEEREESDPKENRGELAPPPRPAGAVGGRWLGCGGAKTCLSGKEGGFLTRVLRPAEVPRNTGRRERQEGSTVRVGVKFALESLGEKVNLYLEVRKNNCQSRKLRCRTTCDDEEAT